MKKTICILSAFIFVLSVFSACSSAENSSKNVIIEHPNTSIKEAHSTTEAKYTLGSAEISQKVETGKDKYEMNYFDDKGNGVKKEFYEDDVLKYYIETSGTDKNGNAAQEKYYAPDGTLFGVFDKGFFYDGEGNQISEDVMEANLYKVTN